MYPIRLDEIPDELIDGLGTITNVTFPRQGHTSDVGIVECGEGRFVIKRSKGELYGSWLMREAHVLKKLRSTNLPVPDIYRIVEQKEENQAWTLMRYAEGETLRQALQREKRTDTKHELIFHFGAALSRIHSTHCPDELRGDSDWLEDRVSCAEYNLEHFSIDGTGDLLQFLKSNKPSPVPNTLIHGDFTIDNVLVVDGIVTSIIDWSGGAFGDPRYDLSLAVRPKPNAFEVQSEVDIFFEGYGQNRIDEQECTYFRALSEFF